MDDDGVGGRVWGQMLLAWSQDSGFSLNTFLNNLFISDGKNYTRGQFIIYSH